ncbi:Uncharacterised protein [Streptococcus suis]|nr:Uncharacterised protein [Streptococcus suis]CYW12874.1 Uncharacterised protein [Streptococcus suis]
MQVLLLCRKIYGALRKDRGLTEGIMEDFRKDTEPVHKKIPVKQGSSFVILQTSINIVYKKLGNSLFKIIVIK